MLNPEEIVLLNNEAMRHFEITIDGQKAYIEYQLNDGKIYLTHAEIPEKFLPLKGDEILAEKILIYLEEKRIPLVPMCAFIRTYLKKNPQWQRLLVKGIRIQ